MFRILTIRFFTVSIASGLLAAANNVRLASASLLIPLKVAFRETFHIAQEFVAHQSTDIHKRYHILFGNLH